MTSPFVEKNKDFIIKEYTKNNKSTYEIAQSLNTYPNKIRRTLIMLGVDLRDRSSAQTNAIKSN